MKKKSIIIMLIMLLVTAIPTQVFAAKTIKTKAVKLSATTITLQVGDAVTLTAIQTPVNSTDSLKWTTSKKSVAKVSSNGLVTAVAEGKAVITVKSGSKTAKCTVYVKKFITEKEAKSLIKNLAISDTQATTLVDEKLAASGFINESKAKEITEGILDMKDYITKTTVETMLEEMKAGLCDCDGKYYTKTEVDSMLSDIENGNWEDGKELNLVSGQTLPFTMKISNKEDQVLIINDMTIKKYHYDNYDSDGNYERFKVVKNIKGTLPVSSEDYNSSDRWLGIGYYEFFGDYDLENRVSDLKNYQYNSDTTLKREFKISGNNFELYEESYCNTVGNQYSLSYAYYTGNDADE